MMHGTMWNVPAASIVRTATVDNPTVSVVLPTYNRGAIVLQSVQSVLDLEEQNFEIIAVDDGSQDDTVGILAKLDHPRLTVISLAGNRGAGFARNAGITLSRAPYVAFLDSDDLWLPGRLEQPVSVLRRHPNVGVVLSAFTTEKKRKLTHHQMPSRLYEGEEFERLVARHVLQPTTSGLTVRKDLLMTVGGFNAALRWMEDRDLVMRTARHAGGATIDKPLWHKRWQSDSISSNHNTYFPSLLTFLSNHLIYKDQELEFRNYLIARHLAKTTYHSGILAAMRDYSEARDRLSPRLPPASILLMKYFSARRSRRAQQQELLMQDGKRRHIVEPYSVLS